VLLKCDMAGIGPCTTGFSLMILARRCGGEPGPRRVEVFESNSDMLSASLTADRRISVVDVRTESVFDLCVSSTGCEDSAG
jgi:hypothetical protein